MAEIISPKKAPFFRESREKCFINADKKIRKELRLMTDLTKYPEKASKYSKPRCVRDDNQDNKQEDKDLEPALLTDAENRGMCIVMVIRSANPAGF
jgi:hypothetical protein